MNVEAAFVADAETTEAIKPGKGAFNHPAAPTQPVACLDPTPGDARHDGTLLAFFAATPVVVGLVSMQAAWPAAWATTPVAHPGNGVECGRQHQAVVPVG